MEYEKLDGEISKTLNLEEGSVLALKPRKADNFLEFTYPHELKGFAIPVLNQCVTGKAVAHKGPFMLNKFQGEIDVIYINSLILNSTARSIRKMIAYPICLAGELISVLLVVRKEYDNCHLDFETEDLKKIKSAVEEMVFVRLSKSASIAGIESPTHD